ncbi:GPI mannosyltransferase 1 [Tilletia horrida]|uniref:GPI mannosyltransferase 1 n=1 Tax=Tilletia horrida TaxID=155126 RepID=A0AAN6JX44_9BASI|nr:GPI mannosyltransferase 1 [Tilletia horrida]KAK0570347.1 GPI mannosyltransferase 1 [Tilletia horrida]
MSSISRPRSANTVFAYKVGSVALAVALRAFLLQVGRIQDASSAVPYTDADYAVYTSAASIVLKGCPFNQILDQTGLSDDVTDVMEKHFPNAACAPGWAASAARYTLAADPTRHPVSSYPLDPDSIAMKIVSGTYSIFRQTFGVLASTGNPYERATYRYTPLLALALAPGEYFGWPEFGKWVFAGADVLCGILMWVVLEQRHRQRTRTRRRTLQGIEFQSEGTYWSWYPTLLWLLNPFPAQISTRGSSESILGVFVLLFLVSFLNTNPERSEIKSVVAPAKANGTESATSSAIADDPEPPKTPLTPTFGTAAPAPETALAPMEWTLPTLASSTFLSLAANFKLFPILYGAPILAHLAAVSGSARDGPIGADALTPWEKEELETGRRPEGRSWLQRNRAGIKYALMCAYIFGAINITLFGIFGLPYVQNAIAYHLLRRDHRHNFSPYYLPTYLLDVVPTSGLSSLKEAPGLSALFSAYLPSSLTSQLPANLLSTLAAFRPLFAFVPQFAVALYLGSSLGAHDLVFACAAQTLSFVAFNKVVTSQYFLWFLWLLPLILPDLKFSSPLQGWAVLAVWAGSQALWLSQAYLLEFAAQDVHLRIWAASIVMVFSHTWILNTCLQAWTRARVARLQVHSKKSQ